nr:hypothetical protein [Tanacetum cinerariifolium]
MSSTIELSKVRVFLVTGFACGKLIFPEYMDDDIPPFLRRVFPDKPKNLENKASLGKVAQGKAAKGKVAKGKDAKHKAAQGKAAQPSDIGLDIGIVPQQLSPMIQPDLKERDENWCRKTYDYVTCNERSEQVDDRNRFTRDDEPEAEQNGSGASDRASARAKFKEIKSTREVTCVCDDINEADAAVDDNAKATSVHDDVGVPDATADDNAKATSVCDDIDEADAAAVDNAKAMSVHDDVGVPDVASDDNAKATSVHDNVGVPDAIADDNVKDTEPEVTIVKKTRKKRMSKRQRELPTSTRKRSKRHIQKAVLVADNGEVVKETQLPDSHEDVFQPHALQRMKKEALLLDRPPVIGNYLKEIHIAQEIPTCQKQEYASSKKFLDYLNQAKKLRHWFPWENDLNDDEKFWQSLVAKDATSRERQSAQIVCSWLKNKDTGDEDKDTRGNTRDEKASQEGENQTRGSASILYEFYNDIGKLGLE